FFTPDSIRDREAFRSHVVAALKGISTLDEQTSKEGKTAEDRFLKSYPFHPDLTEIFYTKWTNLESFQRTRGILRSFALALRDAEQAVFATFLHSQPIGQKAVLREIYSLVGHTRPDKIELEKALRRWTEVSWFLDEGAIADAELGGDGKKALPKTWRLGSRPNLRQMHSAACDNVIPDLIEAKLLDEIQKVK